MKTRRCLQPHTYNTWLQGTNSDPRLISFLMYQRLKPNLKTQKVNEKVKILHVYSPCDMCEMNQACYLELVGLFGKK